MTLRRAQVVSQPQAHRDFLAGIDQVADLLAPTLGPLGGRVAGSANDNKKYEVWDDAGTAVRRLIGLGTPQADIGALLLRNMVWRLEQRVGDGGTTAALLARAITKRGMRLLTAGVNAMDLSRGLRAATEAALASVRAQSMPAADEDTLARIAYASSGERALSAVLGEIRYLLGAEGNVTIEKLVAPYLERRYIHGAYFAAKLSSMYFHTDKIRRTATLVAPAVALLTDALTTTADAVPLMEAALAKGSTSLLIVAPDISGAALNLLVANNQMPADKRKLSLLGVKLSAQGDEREEQLRDLATLTGATLLGSMHGTNARRARADQLGSAARVDWARDAISIAAHDAQRAEIRHQVALVQERLAQLAFDDTERPPLQRRLGVLTGGIAELKIGANSPLEREALMTNATRTLRVLTAAQRSGVVPGAGAAFVHAIDALDEVQVSGDAAFGVQLLAESLSAPLMQIAHNSGVEHPATIVHGVRTRGAAATFDAYSRRVVDARESGILDAAGVATTVLASAVSCALMALTTDTIVYHRKPEQSMQP